MFKSTERRHHGVFVLFGDVVMMSEAHIGVLTIKKEKIYSFSVITIKIIIPCNENIKIFTRDHSKRVNILYVLSIVFQTNMFTWQCFPIIHIPPCKIYTW